MWRKTDRFRLDALEPRLLLSADPLADALADFTTIPDPLQADRPRRNFPSAIAPLLPKSTGVHPTDQRMVA